MNKYKRELKEKKREKQLKEKFISVLKENKYQIINPDSDPNYYISGNNIYGYFKFYEDQSNINEFLRSRINGFIVVDHKKCFDKPSKCPCFLKIPTKNISFESRMKYIISQLKFWGSKEGYKISKSFDIDYWIDERK